MVKKTQRERKREKERVQRPRERKKERERGGGDAAAARMEASDSTVDEMPTNLLRFSVLISVLF